MDSSAHHRQRRYLQPHQQEHALSHAHVPSHIQSHDQSSATYSYYQHEPQGSRYHSQNHDSAYLRGYPHQHYPVESAAIHPPGVSISSESIEIGQTHLPVHQSSYYTPEGNDGGLGPAQMNGDIHQFPHRDAGRRGGGAHGKGPSRGRAHGHRDSDRNFPPEPPQSPMLPVSSSGPAPKPPQAQATKPPHMAWCELCRVECNSVEMLQHHKNGKRHKKSLKIHEQLQIIKNDQKLIPQENLTFEAGGNESKAETEEQNILEEAESGDKQASESRMDHLETASRGRGLKRKKRGGRGVKKARTGEGSKQAVNPPTKGKAVPVLCQLCNIACDTQHIFESHLAGKKHLSNLEVFKNQQTALGQVALQALVALYPALHALNPQSYYASTSSSNQVPPQGVHDFQGLAGQLGAYVLSQAQAQTPGPATTALVTAPPQVMGTGDQQDSAPLVVDNVVTPVVVAGSEIAVTVETNNRKPIVPVETNNQKPIVKVNTNNQKPIVKVNTNNQKPIVKVNTNNQKPIGKVETSNRKPIVKVETNNLKPIVNVETNNRKPIGKVETNNRKPIVKVETNNQKPIVTVECEAKPALGTTSDGKTKQLVIAGITIYQDDITVLSD